METPRGPAPRPALYVALHAVAGGCRGDGLQSPNQPPSGGCKALSPHHTVLSRPRVRLSGRAAARGVGSASLSLFGTRTSARLSTLYRGPGCGLQPRVVLMLSPRWDADEDADWAWGLAGFAVPGGTPGTDTGPWPAARTAGRARGAA